MGAIGSKEGKSKIEKFDDSDFAFLRSQIEDYLYQKDLYQLLLGKKKGQKKDKSDEDWAILDRNVIGQIELSFEKIITHNILKEEKTMDLTAALAKMYEQPSSANKVHLMKMLFNLKMIERCSFMSHPSEFNMIVEQLTSIGIMFDDEVQALLILSQFQNWQGSMTTVSNSARKDKIKMSEVVSLILTEEVRRKSTDLGSFNSSSTLNVEQRG